MLVAVNGALRAASVGHEHQILFRQKDPRFRSVHPAFDGGSDLFPFPVLKEHVGHLRAEPEIHPRVLQISLHGQDQGFVLVIPGEFQGAEIRQAADMMEEPLKIQLHLQRAVPVFKGEHGPPVQPEGGIEHLLIEYVFDGLVVQILVPCHKKLHDLHAALLAQVEFAVRMRVPSSLFRGSAEGIVGIVLVQPVKLVQHRRAGNLQGGNAAEQIPQAFKMILHLPSSAHHIAAGRIVDSVAGAARHIHGLQDVDMIPGHLSVPHQKAGRRQGRQAASHDIGAFLLHALRLLRTGKGLIVAAAVVDPLAVSGVLSQLRIPVCAPGSGFLLRSSPRVLLRFLYRQRRRSRACQKHRCRAELRSFFCHENHPFLFCTVCLFSVSVSIIG